MQKRFRLSFVLGVSALALIVVVTTSKISFSNEALPAQAPVPPDNLQTPEKIELGKKLYFDPRLSSSGKISCNSCHDVMTNGADAGPTSKGVHGKAGGRNSPTVWNAAFYSVQFWDGRAPTLEEQAKGPLVNPIEMGMKDHSAVMKIVTEIPVGYKDDIEKVFGKNSLTIDSLVKAIAAYERTLITPDSPFDQFKKGNESAMSAQAKNGYALVQSVGCTSCHSGPHFAGPVLPIGTGFYMKFPTMPNTDYDKKYGFSKDLGRFVATKKPEDKNMWRVPSWRNVAITAPYFHNGKVKTLEEAVKIMAKTQLARDLKGNEVNDIVAFLKSLTGKAPKQSMPKLPGLVQTANR